MELSNLDPTGDPPNGFSIFRPIVLEDLEESSPFFRFYKPVGDVFIKDSDFEETNNSDKCLPNDGNYEDELLAPIINGAGSKTVEITDKVPNQSQFDYLPTYANNNHIYTLLVSGDTKPPIDFERLYTMQNNSGINSNFEALTIWKPIADSGYMALGCVIDTRPYEGTNPPNPPNPPKPPRDSIATIPINSLPNGYYSNTTFDDTNLSNFIGTPHISTFNTLWDSTSFECDGAPCLQNINIICKTKDEVAGSGPTAQVSAASSAPPNINPQYKNKKYSIQKIYDNNNE
jgi:hypothetical protein